MNSSIALKRFSLYKTILGLSAREKSGNSVGWIISGIQIALRIAIYSGMYRVALGADNPAYAKGIWAIAASQTIFGGERPELSIKIGRDIKDGTVAMYLLRPVSYINQAMFSYIGRSIPDQCSIGIFAFGAAFLLTKTMPIPIYVLPFAVLFLLIGIVMYVILQTLLGLTGFWTSDTSGVHLMNHKLNLLFGGIIIPFALLPDTVSKIVRFTPWSVSAAQPGYVSTHFTWGLYVEMMGVLIAYSLIFYTLCLIMSKRGIRKLSIGGG